MRNQSHQVTVRGHADEHFIDEVFPYDGFQLVDRSYDESLFRVLLRVRTLAGLPPVYVALEHIAEFGMAFDVISQNFSVRSAADDEHVLLFRESLNGLREEQLSPADQQTPGERNHEESSRAGSDGDPEEIKCKTW